MDTPISLHEYDCVIFDMDGTLAVSKGPISESMAECLNALMLRTTVAVISGGNWEQFEKQLVALLDPAHFEHLVILPTTGTAMYRFVGGVWRIEYRHVIPVAERARIIGELKRVLSLVGYHEAQTYGDIIEDRESQITFSALGVSAPIEQKALWDRDQKKRQLIATMLREQLHEYTITIGGTTSVDITLKGSDKASGVEQLSKTLSIPLDRILFVGDKLDPGGNDFPVKRLGIKTVAVKDEHDTECLLSSWLM